MAVAGDFRGDDPVDLAIGAVMRERRIAAEHAAAMCVHHTSADRVIDLKPDLVKPLQQKTHAPLTAAMQCSYLARFAPGGNGFKAGT
jgi:hypothetical protein